MKEDFEPKIIYFLCSWCGSGGAETASAEHLSYPENVLPFRVNCTGSLSTVHVLRAFIEGADGIGVSGCHPGDCHYSSGNYKAKRRIELLKDMLPQLGIEPERLKLEWISASEATKFRSAVNGFIDEVTELGPLTSKEKVRSN